MDSGWNNFRELQLEKNVAFDDRRSWASFWGAPKWTNRVDIVTCFECCFHHGWEHRRLRHLELHLQPSLQDLQGHLRSHQSGQPIGMPIIVAGNETQGRACSSVMSHPCPRPVFHQLSASKNGNSDQCRAKEAQEESGQGPSRQVLRQVLFCFLWLGCH